MAREGAVANAETPVTTVRDANVRMWVPEGAAGREQSDAPSGEGAGRLLSLVSNFRGHIPVGVPVLSATSPHAPPPEFGRDRSRGDAHAPPSRLLRQVAPRAAGGVRTRPTAPGPSGRLMDVPRGAAARDDPRARPDCSQRAVHPLRGRLLSAPRAKIRDGRACEDRRRARRVEADAA